MPTNKTHRKTTLHRNERHELESPREMTDNVVDYLTEYARENPGYAALVCLGVGFMLGWKLKPW